MTTIPEVLLMKDGDAINEIQGQISEVYERRPYTGGAFGPTTVQNAVLMDSSGNKIRMSVWGHSDLLPLKGKEWVLHSNGGQGLNAKLNKYKPEGGEEKLSIELKVSKKGTFQHVEVYHSGAGTTTGTKSEAKAAQGATSAPTPAPRPVKSALGHFERLSNVYLQCWETVDRVIHPEIKKFTGKDMTPEQFQSAVSCLYIQANKDNVQVVDVNWRPIPQ